MSLLSNSTELSDPGLVHAPRIGGSGPPTEGLLGHLPAMRRMHLRFFEQCAREHGDMVPLRMGPGRAWLVSHPSLIEELLIARDDSTNRGPGAQRNRRMFGDGLVASSGSLWRSQRVLLNPPFSRAEVTRIAPVVRACAERLADSWRGVAEADIHAAMTRLTLEVMVRILFGERGERIWRQHGVRLERAMRDIPELLLKRMDSVALMVPDWLPLPVNRRFNAALAEIDRVLYPLIGQAQKEGDRCGLLGALATAEGRDGRPLPRRLIRDEIVTMLFAGHETSASALSWTLWLLACHPHEQAALEGMIDERAAAHAIRESLRLYPPAWIIGRGVCKSIEIGGKAIPRGATVLASPWVVHRDERWYNDPLDYRPSRWADGSLARENPRWAWFPFGGGPHLCIGSHFAQLEIQVALETLLVRFRFAPLSGREVRPQAAITLRPEGGLPLRISPLGRVRSW